MNNPFKEGDVVYHTVLGKGRVTHNPSAKEISVRVQFEGEEYKEGGYHIQDSAHLSFDPWPEPNHTRPFEPTLKEGQRIFAVSRGDSSKEYYGFVSKEDKDNVLIQTSTGRITFAKSSYFFYVEVLL